MARLTLLGVEVDLFTKDMLIDYVSQLITCGDRAVIAHHNLHSVYLYHRDSKFRDFYSRASVVYIDGMPLVYWARILGYALTRRHRMTSLDWVRTLMAKAEMEGWRVFYLGGKPGIAALAAKLLREQYPRLMISTHHGFFSSEENDDVLREIESFSPNILMVGMGMPIQEHWILDNLDRLRANVIFSIGACFDYIAGVIPEPPRWLGKVGLEWFYRLLSEPRRLWRRYLVEPWFLLPLVTRDVVIKLRKQTKTTL